MNRRRFLLLAAPLASLALAQPPSRTYRIGYLGSAPVDSVAAPVDALMAVFLRRLQEMGYTEGKNLIVDRRTTEGLNDRYLPLATQLVNLKVDLILAPGTAAALAAKNATSTVPIVTVVVGDPVGSRLILIASFARPGGNITGTSSAGGEVTPKQLELLKEILPQVSRVVVLSNQTTALHATLLKEFGRRSSTPANQAALHRRKVSAAPRQCVRGRVKRSDRALLTLGRAIDRQPPTQTQRWPRRLSSDAGR